MPQLRLSKCPYSVCQGPIPFPPGPCLSEGCIWHLRTWEPILCCRPATLTPRHHTWYSAVHILWLQEVRFLQSCPSWFMVFLPVLSGIVTTFNFSFSFCILTRALKTAYLFIITISNQVPLLLDGSLPHPAPILYPPVTEQLDAMLWITSAPPPPHTVVLYFPKVCEQPGQRAAFWNI